MIEPPRTQYAKNGDLHIAYQVAGEGPIDLMLISEWHLPLDGRWQEPTVARPMRRLATFSRLISFDKRGIGCSDPVPLSTVSAIEEWMDDARTVLDAAGSERAALLAANESGAVALLFAATYPERTAALILANTIPRWLRDDSYPWGMPSDAQDRLIARVAEDWSGGADVKKQSPSLAKDDRLQTWWLSGRRLQASPATAQAIYRTLGATDVRHVLPSIQAPTLVVHRQGSYSARVEHGRYLAKHIPGAKYVELPGEDLFWWPATPRPWSTRSRSSSPVSVPSPRPTGCWPRSCSPTSWDPPSGRPSWATAGGGSCSTATTRSCAGSWNDTAAGR
jgi:pimeloyl-ACP methyl ester carboxylesterase